MKIDVWRSRWAAAGAAIAITLGGGGLFAASAMGNPAMRRCSFRWCPSECSIPAELTEPVPHDVGPAVC